MFRTQGKKIRSTQTRLAQELTPVSTAVHLLAEEKRQELLHKIKDTGLFDDARYEQLCVPLIQQFAQYCQSLPEPQHGYYSQPGGILDHALNRTEAAMTLFLQYVAQEGRDISDEQRLWGYALFSASILQGVGKLQTDFLVDLYDANGTMTTQWNPLLQGMSVAGRYYDYQFQKDSGEDFRRRLNPLLARQLMPVGGFAWIASNPQVLAVWLALLHEDWQSAGVLAAILIRADAIAIQRYWHEQLIGYAAHSGRASRLTTFSDAAPLSLDEIEQITGMEFIQWLMKSLDSGRIMINKAPLFSVPGGVLMCADIYKLFMLEHPEYKNWQSVQRGLLALGIHQTAGDGSTEARYELEHGQGVQSGVVLDQYAAVLPNQVKLFDTAAQKVRTMEASELVYCMSHIGSAATLQQQLAGQQTGMQLNAAGQWISANLEGSVSPGNKQRG